MLSSDHRVEVHTDGAVFVAVNLQASDIPTELERTGITEEEVHPVSAIDVVTWTVTLLSRAARYSVIMGASGDLEVRLQLFGSAGDAATGTGERIQEFSRSILLTENFFGALTRAVPNSRPVKNPTAVEATVGGLVVSTPSDLIATAARLANEVFAEFGQLPSDPLIGDDGLVILENCGQARAASLRDWATSHSLTR